MNNILSKEELLLIHDLNCAKIIQHFPDLVRKVIENSVSYTEVLLALNLHPSNNSARQHMKRFIAENGLTPLNYNNYRSGQTLQERVILSREDVLKRFVKSDAYVGTQLRKWVIAHDLIPYVCSVSNCLLSQPDKVIWNGKSIILDLDHINGDNKDNRLENLRFLCPNCHSQTETFKGRNLRQVRNAISSDKAVRKENFENLPDKEILKVEVSLTSTRKVANKYEVTEYALKKKINGEAYHDPSIAIDARGEGLRRRAKANQSLTYPPIETIVARVVSEGYESLARELGVSGNAIRKYLKNRLGYAPKRGEVSP